MVVSFNQRAFIHFALSFMSLTLSHCHFGVFVIFIRRFAFKIMNKFYDFVLFSHINNSFVLVFSVIRLSLRFAISWIYECHTTLVAGPMKIIVCYRRIRNVLDNSKKQLIDLLPSTFIQHDDGVSNVETTSFKSRVGTFRF